jgi:hypothetical protein
MTSWDTNWIAPILNDSLLISDFINDSTLELNADNSIQFILNRKLVDLDLAELIELPDTNITQVYTTSFPSLTLSPGTNFVNEIEEHDFELNGAVLSNARLISGTAIITIENPLPTVGIFEIEFPGVSKNGVTYSRIEEVPAANGDSNGLKRFELDLSYYSIDMRGENGNAYNKLQTKMTVQTSPNGPSVTITNQDVVKFRVDFEGLSVDYAKGYFGSRSFTDTAEVTIDALANITAGSISLDEIDFDLTISNGIKVAAQGKVVLFESNNYNNTVVSLTHPEFNQFLNLDPAQGALSSFTPSEKILNFKNGNSNIAPFLENLGYKYKVGYEIKINPWGNVSGGNDEIFPSSRVGVNLNADFPLNLGVNNLTIQDTFEVDFLSDERFVKAKEGKFILKSENSFPFGGGVELFLLNENKEELGVISSNQVLEAAQLNTTSNGHVQNDQVIEFEINNEIANKLVDVKHIILKISVNSAYTPSNIVNVNSRLKFLLRTSLKLNAEL